MNYARLLKKLDYIDSFNVQSLTSKSKPQMTLGKRNAYERLKATKALTQYPPTLFIDRIYYSIIYFLIGLCIYKLSDFIFSGEIMKYTKLEQISIKHHPEVNESWVQQIIADDPAILGLGDIILKDKERYQPRAGRLDLLLQDNDTNKRYEIEIQLGAVDESHIIRTIEYYDYEKKRYPQYEHCGVLIAEDITSRFLNVLGFLNGKMPLIVIQMTAIKTETGLGLSFTKVFDEVQFGMPDEDEVTTEPADREFWETKRSNKKIVSMVDTVLEIVKKIDPALELKYNKYYIGLIAEGSVNNFITCKPKKGFLRLNIYLPKSEEVTKMIEGTDLILMDYSRWGSYRLNLKDKDIKENMEMLTEVLKKAYENRL